MRCAGLLTALGAALYALPLAVWLRYSERSSRPAVSPRSSRQPSDDGRRSCRPRSGRSATSSTCRTRSPTSSTRCSPTSSRGSRRGAGCSSWSSRSRSSGSCSSGRGPSCNCCSSRLRSARARPRPRLRRAGEGRRSRPVVHALAGNERLARGGANIALLFLCGSLPLFLGAEVTGGSRVVRRTLVLSGTIVAAYLVFAAFPSPPSTRRCAMRICPGMRSPPPTRAAGSRSPSGSAPSERRRIDPRRVSRPLRGFCSPSPGSTCAGCSVGSPCRSSRSTH